MKIDPESLVSYPSELSEGVDSLTLAMDALVADDLRAASLEGAALEEPPAEAPAAPLADQAKLTGDVPLAFDRGAGSVVDDVV